MLPPFHPWPGDVLYLWTPGWPWLARRTWTVPAVLFLFFLRQESTLPGFTVSLPQRRDVRGLKAEQASLGSPTVSHHHRPAAHAVLWFDLWRTQGWPGHRPASGNSPENCIERVICFQWQFHSWLNVKRLLINGKLKEGYVWWNKYLGFVPTSPETLRIFWVIGVSFVVHNDFLLIPPEFILMKWVKVGPLDSLRMAQVTGKTKWLESESFEPHHWPPGRGGEAGHWAPQKLLIQSSGELLGWCTHQSAGRVAWPERAWEHCTLFPRSLPYSSFLFGSSWVVSFIINQYTYGKCFLEFCEYF